jgi:hypothetical protein
MVEHNYNNIPHEMRLYAQWCVWRYEEDEATGKPTKVPYSPRNGQLMSVTDPSTWSAFDEAVGAVNGTNRYAGVGFVLSEQDPFCFIDLDDPYALHPDGTPKHKDPRQVLDRQITIYNEFQSYAERSPSGKGLHIIVRGAVPSGRRRSSVELYSNERYMTMTGEVYRNLPIVDYSELTNSLWKQMGEGRQAVAFYAGLEKAKYPDDKVIEIASNAANNEKFNELYFNGNWQRYYPSQSEADFALVDILTFYSENRQQVQRLFLASKLGQREKSRAQYRINYMLARCFDRMLPPVDIEFLRNDLMAAVAKSKENSTSEAESVPALIAQEEPYTVPPGLVGVIARFIYDAAPRPVPEIALAGAIGFMSGIVGRSYNVSGGGLNQYVLLLAPTGTGKEAIASGIDKLVEAIKRTVPAAVEFIGPAEISSGQALTKYMSHTSKSFVSIVGEFGLALAEMCSQRTPPHLLLLRRMYLDLYHKSGEGKVLRPRIYSDKEKNTETIQSPAFSILGESTPERFYETLHESMIGEGLLPRFTIIEYTGPRPPLQENHESVQPKFDLVEQLGSLCAHSLMLNGQHKAIKVQMSPGAAQILKQFNEHCDTNINSSDREVRKQLWNRAHVKAMRLAAVVAVGCDPYQPTINEAVAQWAIAIIVTDVRNLLARFECGDFGDSGAEHHRISKVLESFFVYVLTPWEKFPKTYVSQKLHDAKIVTFTYLHRRLCHQKTFEKDGNAQAGEVLRRTLRTLVDRGDIEQLSPQRLSEYKYTGVAYMLSQSGHQLLKEFQREVRK